MKKQMITAALVVSAIIGMSIHAMADDTIKLTMRTPFNEQGNSRGAIFEEVLNQYLAEHPEIEVEYEAIDPESNNAKVNVEIAGGTTPDIFVISTASITQQYAEAGALADLTAYFEADPDWKNSFVTGALTQIDGKNYTVPNEGFAELMWYNTEIFEECGLSVPTTWDEFIQTVQTLKDNGYIPIAMGGKQTWVGAFLFQMLMDNEGGTDLLYKCISGEESFNNDDYRRATQMFIDLVQMDAFNKGAANTEEAEGDAMFYQEMAAMECTGTWAIGKWLSEDANEGFDQKVSAFVLPMSAEGKGGPSYFGSFANSSFVISSSLEGEKLDAAVDLLKYVTGPAYMERFTTEGGQLSTVVLPDLDESMMQKPLLEAQKALETVEGNVNAYDGIMPQAVNGAWTTAIQTWLAGDTDIDAGLNSIDEAVQKQLKAEE